jgi:hypothetical protein
MHESLLKALEESEQAIKKLRKVFAEELETAYIAGDAKKYGRYYKLDWDLLHVAVDLNFEIQNLKENES